MIPIQPNIPPESFERIAQQRVNDLSAEIDERARELDARRVSGKSWGKGRTFIAVAILTLVLFASAIAAFTLLHQPTKTIQPPGGPQQTSAVPTLLVRAAML